MFLIFYFWSWIFYKSSKFWAASCKKESNLLLVRFTVCIESCLPIGWRTEKSAKVQLYFGSGCRMMEFFTCEPQSKEQLMSLPHLWSTVWWKRSRLEHMQTVNRTSRRIGGLFAWSGSELWSCFKYSRSKIKKFKTYSSWCPFKGLSNDTTLMQIQSGRTVHLRTSGFLHIRYTDFMPHWRHSITQITRTEDDILCRRWCGTHC